MKAGLYIATALLAGALFAHLLLSDPGYVAIRFAGRLIEMSIITFALLLSATYALIRVLIKIISARRWWRHAQAERRQERARRSLTQGLLQMAQGEWGASEETLTRSAHNSVDPAAHYLVAARAAELQGAAQRRDELLTRALEASPEKRAPALIMQAELHLKHNQLPAAQAALEQLDACNEQTPRGLLLLARVFRQSGDWQKLQALEPRLRKSPGVDAKLADELVSQIYLDRLKAALAAGDRKELASCRKDIPRSLAQRPEIVVAYARAAIACNEHAAAQTALADLIERQWEESAVLVFGELQASSPLETLERAERWLHAHDRDPALLLTCARLSIHAELYGKARSYLETSLSLRPRLETFQLLANLLEQLGERERALKVLGDALIHTLGRKPNLPKVRSQRWLEQRHAERRKR